MVAVLFPTTEGTEAGRWCPDGRGVGTHCAATSAPPPALTPTGEQQPSPIPDNQVFRVPAGEEKNHLAQVAEGLWIGDRFAAADRALLDKRGIAYVVNCAAAPPDKDAKWVEVAAKLGFVVPCFHTEGGAAGPPLRYLTVPLKDEPQEPVKDYFDRACSFLEDARRTGAAALVHCEAGRSRSATVVMAFLMRQKKCSLSQALAQVRLQWGVLPNEGFVAQLHEYAQRLGIAGAEGDYVRAADAGRMGLEEAVEKNCKAAMWRLQQGAWFTSPAAEAALLQGTGYDVAEYVAAGAMLALDQDPRTRGLMRELARSLLGSGAAEAGRVGAAYERWVLEDPSETEYPLLEDLLLDVPFAEQYLGAFLEDARAASCLTEAFTAYIKDKYPKVFAHMPADAAAPPAAP